MRFKTIAATVILASLSATVVFAADAPPAASTTMTTAATPLGDLLDNPASKAVLTKYAPMLTAGGQVDQARPMTVKSLQQYIPELTDDVLGKIDADLAKIGK